MNGFKQMKHAVALGALVAMAGCMSVDEAATRNAPATTGIAAKPVAAQNASLPAGRQKTQKAGQPRYTMQGFTVDVPETLTVSEANAYFPNADIVWRGDKPGDRHDQVHAILSGAARLALKGSKGGAPAIADIKLQRFHSVTEKVRYSTGGWHSITFELTVRHAKTGEILDGPRRVDTVLTAFGGQRALEAERIGQTQKARVTSHLINVLRHEVLDLAPLAPSQPRVAKAEKPKLQRL